MASVGKSLGEMLCQDRCAISSENDYFIESRKATTFIADFVFMHHLVIFPGLVLGKKGKKNTRCSMQAATH